MAPAQSPGGALSNPSRRHLDDAITEGIKTPTEQQAPTRPKNHHASQEQDSHQRSHCPTLKGGKSITTATCEDPSQARAEQRLLEPIIRDDQGLPSTARNDSPSADRDGCLVEYLVQVL